MYSDAPTHQVRLAQSDDEREHPMHYLVADTAEQAHGILLRAVEALEAAGYDPKRIDIEPCGMAVEVNLIDTLSELCELAGYLPANGQLHGAVDVEARS